MACNGKLQILWWNKGVLLDGIVWTNPTLFQKNETRKHFVVW